jgi:hypothetical protein
MTMAVNMAYVPKPESGVKVLKANFQKRKATAILKSL